MNVADLRRLYAYTDWANERIVAAVEASSRRASQSRRLRYTRRAQFSMACS